jgi:4-hydroxy-tetrahydrodipicolinate synthase
MCTPLSDDGEVDVPSLESLVEYLIDGGVHGIFPLGSTGEMSLLTEKQRSLVLHTTVRAVNGRLPVVAGIFDSSTLRCIENARAAKEAGVDGLVLTSIYYYRPSQHEIIDHFRAIRRAIDLPVLAYDIPDTVHVKLEVSTIKTMAAEGLIVGVKDTTDNLESIRKLKLATQDCGLSIFTGQQLMLDVALIMGANGGVPGLANVLPAEYAKLYEFGVSGNSVEATRLQERLCAFFWEMLGLCDPLYSSTSAWLGGDKAALKLKGVIRSNHVSAPLHTFGPQEEERLADVMRRHAFS